MISGSSYATILWKSRPKNIYILKSQLEINRSATFVVNQINAEVVERENEKARETTNTLTRIIRKVLRWRDLNYSLKETRLMRGRKGGIYIFQMV